MNSYTHRCGKTVPDTGYHCAGCHETFRGLTAFDAHRVDFKCVIEPVKDPYATGKGFWLDGKGLWHIGKKMTDEEKKEVWG